MIRVRFAPSPTGNLHIGSIRTALFNWLFVRSLGGKFILRIEDTDTERSSKEFENDILAGLKWLGLDWDEGPYYQSTNNDLYVQYAKELVAKGLAYESDDAVYLKISQEGDVIFNDLVRGSICFAKKEIKDQVLLKSNGIATYNFAVVIDDYLMKISHVIRGEDHISNTPKQILIYQALGFELPLFAHIPIILGEDRSKLSKRHGATSVNQYKKDGYLPEVMVNFLALLSWTPADGQEIMSIPDIIAKFSLDRVAKSGAIFNSEKLDWLNGQKLRSLENIKILELARDFLLPNNKNIDWWLKAIEGVKSNLTLLKDLATYTEVFFVQEPHYDLDKFKDLQENHQLVLNSLLHKIMASNDLDNNELEAQSIIDQVEAETGLKRKLIYHPIRYALSAQTAGPPLQYLICLLGKETCIRRLEKLIQKTHIVL